MVEEKFKNFKRILALDYGRKRWGLAFCDELRVVFTLPAATQTHFEERLAYFKETLVSRKINLILVGLPLLPSGDKSPLTIEVETFIKNILTSLNIPIRTIDETLSSFEAESTLPKPKIKKGHPQRDGTVDSKAAALLLEEYLAQHPE